MLFGKSRLLNTPSNSHWWSLLLLVLIGITLAATPRVYAQGDDESKEAEASKDETTDDTKEEAEEEGPGSNYFWFIVESSGIFGAIIFIESFLLIAFATQYTMQISRGNFLPPDFLAAFEVKLNEKQYQEAFELANQDDSFIARVLASGMSRLQKGYEDSVAGMEQAGAEEAMAYEHKLSYISLIASTAPMLGLLGTVQGMIDSFIVIATSNTTPKPKELAGGISTALVTTMEGLVVAVPAIIFYGLLRNRLSKFIFEVTVKSEQLMSRFASVGKKPAQ